jgi:hypothetical protein
MPEPIPDRKPVIVDLLRLIASEEQQLAYDREVPHVDITGELLCMWFDDQYHPHNAFFISCFTAHDLAALAEFHRFYDEQRHRLPRSQGTVRTWLASPIWRQIMEKAHETLTRIEP